VLEAFPQNQPAQKALKALQGNALKTNQPALTQAQIDSIIALYYDGQIQQALSAWDILITRHPDEAMLYNSSGSYYAGL